MLTQADDFPVHQTPEPVAIGPTDRNFYDRYFFNAFTPDGRCFVGIAFGVYPNLNLADAHFSVRLDGVQHCVHASRFLNWERLDLRVGPIRIRVLEPLQRLEVTVDAVDGIAASIVFEGRAFPIQEPRFTHRFGTRTFMDITRLTQNCRVGGWVEAGGQRVDLAPGSLGTRDRSWGVRPIGAPDAQPLAPAYKPSVFWLWTPVHFDDFSVFFHVMADETGTPWNTRAVLSPDGAGPDQMLHVDRPRQRLELPSGLRHPLSARVTMPFDDGDAVLTLEAGPRFHMKGIGYRHPTWTHGSFHGEQAVETERFETAALDLTLLENLHVQAFARVRLQRPGRPEAVGMGTFEYTMTGAYAPLGLA